MKRTLILMLAAVLAAMSVLSGCAAQQAAPEPTAAPAAAEPAPEAQAGGEVDVTSGIPEVDVNFYLMPYPDHSESIIAIEKGYFEDVGININYTYGDSESLIPLLAAGTVDVTGGCESNFLGSLGDLKVQNFAMSVAFQGYGFMAQADRGYKTFQDFTGEGMSPKEAIVACMQQFKGKDFASPTDTGLIGFRDVCFQIADMTINDLNSIVTDDSTSVSLMLAGDADLQLGGVTTRITLQNAGFITVLTTTDIMSALENPSEDSLEERSIVHAGYHCTEEYANENHETLLRMASVRWRLNDYVKNNKDEAAEMHSAYLNQIAGTSFTADDIKIFYEQFIPMYTFEDQNSWFYDTADPFYYTYCAGAILNSFEEQGIIEVDAWTPEDYFISDDIYKEMEEYKAKAEENFAALDGATGPAQELCELAQHYYDIFDYYDAYLISQRGVDAM